MKRNLFYLMSLAVAGGALVGCDTEEGGPCTVASAAVDCAGYACIVVDGETAGVCATTAAEGCAAGYEVGTDADNNAICVATSVTCADLDCGAYLCDETTNACLTECADATDCVADGQCDDIDGVGVCSVVTETPYMYVAVVSSSTGTDALDNQNPGPDIDAIALSTGGAETLASEVVSFQEGAEGDEANTRPLSTHNNAVLAKDTVTGGVCDLDAQPGYVALGDNTGYIVVGFGRELAAGDQVVVYEVDSNYCADAATERPDTYEVYATTDASVAMTPGTAADIRANWCLVGTSGANGGVLNAAFTCDAM